MFANFFNIRSGHFFFLIILAILFGVVGVVYAYPAYQIYAAWGAIGMIAIIPIIIYANAMLQGPPHPHIEHSIFDGVTGIAYRIEDFFIDFFNPAEKVPDIWPMMKDMHFCPKCKKWTKIDEGRICLTCGLKLVIKQRPVYFGGRWWYPYLVRTKWPISFGDFKDCNLFIFVLPRPWDAFMMFGRRPQGAFAQTEVIDHGTSTHVDSIVAPFAADHLGIKIPIFLSVFSRSSVLMITKTWKEEMNEFARYIKVMDDLIIDVQDSIYPAKELEEIAKTEFPVLLAEYGARKKNERKPDPSLPS